MVSPKVGRNASAAARADDIRPYNYLLTFQFVNKKVTIIHPI